MAAGALKGLELKFEIIEREGRKETATGMFIGCSWASLEQYGPELNAGSMCVCLRVFVCVCRHVHAHLCVYVVMRVKEEEREIGIIRTKA